uniref:Cordon-bleu WH2 repeat protein like 1 n=1 Tax=Sparus aurata TaxID=8175 RepID=A0A671XGS3_SPAAU
MEVDICVEKHPHSCPREFVKPMSLVMDDHGSLPHPRSSGLRVSTKSKAPSPPGLKKLDSPGFSQWYPGNPHLTMDQKENLIDKDLSLVVILPGGEEKMTTVHGSKPLMDLLVTLCAKYHLNPSSHTLELVTANKKNTKLKPNALIGTLDAEKIILKPKGEDKNKKTGPQMPEPTVRMVINYKKTQKTILRVSPRVPLAEHLPAICEKCEFDIETTVLLRDVQSLAPLDLSCSLNDYAIREVYARDMKVFSARQPASPVCPASPTHAGTVTPGKDKNQKEEENKGLFSKFRKSKKKSEQATTASAPASPVLVSKPRPLSMALPGSNSPPLSSPTTPTYVPKKRRAPQPPILVSQSSSDLCARRRLNSEPNAQLDSDQIAGLSRGSSAESSLKRTKRKAPPPPTTPSAAVQEAVLTETENLQDGGPCQVENASQQTVANVTVSEVSTPESVEGDCRTLPRSLPPPVMQDAEVQANNNTVPEQSDRSESPVATSTSQPIGEDAQVQTDATPLPPPPQEHVEVPSSANVLGSESLGKKDMATLKEELDLPDLERALSHTSETSPCQELTPSASATTKAPSIYATNSEPKPKPSNELTRDYIPKMGMTTYTIVPQKSLDKLRYFEVALTLETPNAAPEEGPNIGALQLEDSTAAREQTEVSKEKSELHSAIPREDLLTSTTTTSTTTTTTDDTVNGSIPESIHSSSPTSLPKADDKMTPQAGSPAEVKEVKIPPATKPKPGSFRLSQHKKTPGYYVTSAAEKSLTASPGSGQKEAQASSERAQLPPPPPPPPPTTPPPVQFQAESTGAANVEPSPKGDDKNVGIMRITRQSSLPSKEPSVGLSLEKLRSFAAPRPYSPATPSRFAQAVSSAVKRSQSLSYRPKSPHSPHSPHSPVSPLSPITSHSPVIESKGLSKLKEGENKDMDDDKGSTLQGVEDALPAFGGIVQTEGESSL